SSPLSLLLFFSSLRHLRDLPSFPTRRSSDLINVWPGDELEGPFTRPSGTLSPSEGERDGVRGLFDRFSEPRFLERSPAGWERDEDRKSTRLNSSHLGISYAVFCLKKKKKTKM